jgi:WD40 repeat protein
MKRIVILMVALGLSVGSLYAMQHVALLTSDNEEFELDVSKISSFGTIKDLVDDVVPKTSDGKVDYAAQKEPIPLRVSHDVLSKLVSRVDPNSLTIENAIALLNGAVYLGADALSKQYAKITAKLAISDALLRQLQQDATQHPLLRSQLLSGASKELIYQHMPKTYAWMDKCTIPYDDPGIITFAPRSKKMTVISRLGKKVDILDTETRRSLQSYALDSWKDFEKGRVRSAILSSDDTRIAIASEDKTAIVAEVNTGNIVCRVKHATGVYSANFSSNDKALITLTQAGVRRVTDIASGEMSSRVRYFDTMPEGMDLDTISPNGQMLAVKKGGTPDRLGVVHGGELRIINADRGNKVCSIGTRSLFERIDPIFSSDNTQVVAVCDSNEHSTSKFGYYPKLIKIINLATTPIKEHVLEYDADDNNFFDNSIKFSPDGSFLAINRGNGLLDIVNTHSGLVDDSLKVARGYAASAAFSSDNSELAVGFPGEIKVFRAVAATTMDQALLTHLRKYCAKNKQQVLPASLPWVMKAAESLYY